MTMTHYSPPRTSVQESEHAGVNDIKSAVGIALLDDAGDVDFTRTCRGGRGEKVSLNNSGIPDIHQHQDAVSVSDQIKTHLAKSSQYSHCSLQEW
jgi:hypothetical protein